MAVSIRDVAVAVSATALCLTLAACGGDDTGAEATQAQSQSGKVESAPDLNDGWKGVLNDVKVDECPTEAGEVTASGEVVNSAKGSRDITLLVTWNPADSTNPLLQLSVTKKDVPAGETESWSVEGELPSDAGQCFVIARSGKLTKG